MKFLKRLCAFLLVLVLAGACATAYAFLVEPRWLKVRTHAVPAAIPALRVVQFSDVHIASRTSVEDFIRLVARINALRPDVVVFTGDLFDNYNAYGPGGAVADALGDIEAPYGKFAVWGNHDRGGGASRVYAQVLEEAGFTLLTNETALFALENGSTVLVGGLDDAMLGRADPEGLSRQMEQEADYRLLLLHEPDVADSISPGAADLVLSGHSHGGQIWLPLEYAVTPPLARRYVRGFYEVGGMRLYVNTGIGTTGIPARLGVRPELTVFELG